MSDFQKYLEQEFSKVDINDFKEETQEFLFEDNNEIGELVYDTRMEIGMTQKELAERSKVAQANISKIENGSDIPSVQVLRRLAKGFNKELIISFEEKEEFE